MKKIIASAVAVGCLAAAGAVYAGLPAATGVNGSLHDMTRVVPTNADAMGRVCVYCHTPHHAESNLTPLGMTPTDTSPLWNRESSPLTYTAYQWVTPANMADDDGNSFEILDPLAGPSRLCMSCHDGAVAVDEHGTAMELAGSNIANKQTGSKTVAQLNGGRANLGADLTQTHPIGFDYVSIRERRNAVAGVASGSDTEIVDPDKYFATSIGITPDLAANQGTYNNVVRTGQGLNGHKRIKDVLFGGRIMTCASCHEVHNKENATQENFNGTMGTDTAKAPNYFLYAKEKESLICLSCHVK